MLHAGLLPDVVDGETGQPFAVPAIGAAIADMGQGVAPAADHQGGEGGQQRLAIAGGLQPAILRQQQPFQRLGHRPGFRSGVVVLGQGLKGGARRQATVRTTADAIGEGEQMPLGRRQRRAGLDTAQGVLVFLARTGRSGFGEGEF